MLTGAVETGELWGRRAVPIGNLSTVWAAVGVEATGAWHRLMKGTGESCDGGCFSTILSSASTFLSALLGDEIEMISAGFSISAVILAFSSAQIAELFQDRREPIAYMYNL